MVFGNCKDCCAEIDGMACRYSGGVIETIGAWSKDIKFVWDHTTKYGCSSFNKGLTKIIPENLSKCVFFPYCELIKEYKSEWLDPCEFCDCHSNKVIIITKEVLLDMIQAWLYNEGVMYKNELRRMMKSNHGLYDKQLLLSCHASQCGIIFDKLEEYREKSVE
jgi:hypothetical protein